MNLKIAFCIEECFITLLIVAERTGQEKKKQICHRPIPSFRTLGDSLLRYSRLYQHIFFSSSILSVVIKVKMAKLFCTLLHTTATASF